MGEKPNADDLKWFAPADEFPEALFQRYVEALSRTSRRVDVLLDAADLPEAAQGEFIARLAEHPRVAQIILFKLPHDQRVLVSANAAMLGVSVRFCDSDDEKHMLLNKRRSTLLALETPKPRVSDLYGQLNLPKKPGDQPTLSR